MGGGAFAQAAAPGAPTLRTPRMSTEQYETLKKRWIEKLQLYLGASRGTVGCVREAPEKLDYGDIDLFVAINSTSPMVDFVELAKAMGANGVIVHGPGKCSLAVQLDGPDEDDATTTVVYHSVKADRALTAPISSEAYAHIDLEIIPKETLDWWMFYASYGGMSGLLGQIVKGLGFSLNDRGLWLRMMELDRSKEKHGALNIAEKDGMIFLSREPYSVMMFLGLPVEDYHKGFQTIEQLYRWLGNCRLLIPETTGFVGQLDTSQERQREKRPLYRGFFKQWLPAFFNAEEQETDPLQRALKIGYVRTKYAEIAVESFECKVDYENKREALIRAIDNAAATVALRPLVERASGRSKQHLTEMMRAFRRHVGCTSNGQPYLLSQPRGDVDTELHTFLGEDGRSLRDVDALEAWIRENWETVRNVERQRGKNPA